MSKCMSKNYDKELIKSIRECADPVEALNVALAALVAFINQTKRNEGKQ